MVGIFETLKDWMDTLGSLSRAEIKERLASAQKFVDYVKANPDRSKVPEGILLTSLRFANTPDPDKRILKGSINGIKVSAVLTKNETTAMLNKMLPMEEIAMANKDFGNKVRAIANGITREESRGLHK
jgi:hypothetical protein